MSTQTQVKKPRLFNLRRLPMDMARIVCAPLLLLYRMKRITPTGDKYRGRIQGGAILAANHTSFSDPFLVGTAVWYRRLFFLAAETVMKGKLRSWLLRGVGAIRIDREIADLDAIRKSAGVLKEGHLLAIFPQGNLSQDSDALVLKSGAVLIALQADVPIVPMYIQPRKHWYSRRVVVIGNTIYPKALIQKKFPSTADIDKVSLALQEEMQRCILHP